MQNFIMFLNLYIVSCHTTTNKFYSQWESHNLFVISSLNINPSEWSFLLTTLIAAFLVVCSILQWKMSWSDSFSASLGDEFFCVLLKQLFIECPSDILDMFLWQPESIWKNPAEENKPFSSVIEVLLDSSYLIYVAMSWSITDDHDQLGIHGILHHGIISYLQMIVI